MFSVEEEKVIDEQYIRIFAGNIIHWLLGKPHQRTASSKP